MLSLRGRQQAQGGSKYMNAYKVQGYRGGIADDPYSGVREAFRFGYGLNIRGETNVLKCNQKLKVDLGNEVIVDLILFYIPASNGILYGFGDTGKIYRKNGVDGTWEVVYTDANGKITGAAEYTNNDGVDNYIPYLYWATETKVSRIKLSGIWPTDVEHDWGTLNGDPSWHTMAEALGVLLICDGKDLAMVDYEGAFAAGANPALDLPRGHRNKCLLGLDQLVVFGSTKGDKVEEGWLWTWDKIQPSWIQRRMIAERGINAILQGEFMAIQAGVKGGLYFWDTSSLIRIKKFPGEFGWVNPGGVTIMGGLPLFGLNGSNKCGVYSYGRLTKNDPYALNLEYIPSHEKMENVNIGALTMYGDVLHVSWKDGIEFGVDRIDADNKAEGRYEGMVFDGGEPFTQKSFRTIKLVTKKLPKDTSVEVFYRVNEDDEWQTAAMQDSSESFDKEGKTKAIFSIETGGDEDEPGQGEEYEVALNIHPSGNNTPEVKSVTSYFEPVGIL
ncbi:hypothetical protein A3J16_02890 [Candidatus Daviesbacteria bacterium RIFCSPLOWO2_02_FULL_39_13]|nr:MAG: hypothetical protein A3A53_03000 [Candidatus Daviesbacteria bacterium RIFCSPLOWO2_01_FULL_39_23]OGE67847.1 MAG: hypothetical protein A3J16_02890 [Candidatus Daviesbacteria bacterium RIFCSPLOWO2_02_FULL_39_13]